MVIISASKVPCVSKGGMIQDRVTQELTKILKDDDCGSTYSISPSLLFLSMSFTQGHQVNVLKMKEDEGEGKPNPRVKMTWSQKTVEGNGRKSGSHDSHLNRMQEMLRSTPLRGGQAQASFGGNV
jgi:hypothetical protein